MDRVRRKLTAYGGDAWIWSAAPNCLFRGHGSQATLTLYGVASSVVSCPTKDRVSRRGKAKRGEIWMTTIWATFADHDR